LKEKLLEEFLVVTLVCAVFLFHLRSALVIILSLPVGILVAFAIMHIQGINANIMSLGGIAIAIGAMVDAAIVMIENAHRHLEGAPPGKHERSRLIARAASEVGPALFFSLLIITLSFLPVFTLQAQEGRLFAPLAFTKTYAMAAAAGLSVTLVPVLMGYFVRGKLVAAERNPVNRLLIALYRPVIAWVLKAPATVLAVALLAAASMAWPLAGWWPLHDRLGSEFMPDLDEGDLLYMPSTFPAVSIGKGQQILQQTDRLIRTVPEVERVFGKLGRAETATDPAPLTMIETTIRLKPKDQWRDGMTTDKLRRELDALVQIPGLSNAWVMPVKNRIDMLATGIKTPVGVKVAGPDLGVIETIGEDIERALRPLPGTVSVFSERVVGGRYIKIDINRPAASRYGLNIADIQEIIAMAVGGMNVTESVEKLERYPVNLRYPRDLRDSDTKLAELPIQTPVGAQIALGDVADVKIVGGPAMIKSENARPNGWVYVDIRGRDIGSYVDEARRVIESKVDLPAGYSLDWSGQFEYLERAERRLFTVIPVTLAIIVLLLYMSFRRIREVLIILATLPLALVGGIWLLYWLDYDLSVAVGVGFIALAGVSVEIGVVMLVYLNQAYGRHRRAAAAENRPLRAYELRRAIVEGALLRVRPVLMTVAAIVAGLLPIMFGHGTGSEVMRRIAAPMVGGMLSATVLTLLVIPAVFLLWHGSLKKE
ncbi:MAG: CusA/CzcA family heavy metal efflux RND transporter, partial [Gammaproteobacteria bacterium]